MVASQILGRPSFTWCACHLPAALQSFRLVSCSLSSSHILRNRNSVVGWFMSLLTCFLPIFRNPCRNSLPSWRMRLVELLRPPSFQKQILVPVSISDQILSLSPHFLFIHARKPRRGRGNGEGGRHMAIARSSELPSSPRYGVFTPLMKAYEHRQLFALNAKIRDKSYGYRRQVDSVRWTISQKGVTDRTPDAGISIPDSNMFSVYCGMLLAYLTHMLVGLQNLASQDVPVLTGSATGCEVAGTRVANFFDKLGFCGD
jgi:hypothetical protein